MIRYVIDTTEVTNIGVNNLLLEYPNYSPNSVYTDGTKVHLDGKIYEVYNETVTTESGTRLNKGGCPLGSISINTVYTDENIFLLATNKMECTGVEAGRGIKIQKTYTETSSQTSADYITRVYSVMESYYTFSYISFSYTLQSSTTSQLTAKVYPNYDLCVIGEYFEESGYLRKKLAVVDTVKTTTEVPRLYEYSLSNPFKAFDLHSDTKSLQLRTDVAFMQWTFPLLTPAVGLFIIGVPNGTTIVIDGQTYTSLGSIFKIDKLISVGDINIEIHAHSVSNILFITEEIEIAVNSLNISTHRVGKGKTKELVGGRLELRKGAVSKNMSVKITFPTFKYDEVMKKIEDSFREISVFQVAEKSSDQYTNNVLDLYVKGTVFDAKDSLKDDVGKFSEVVEATFNIVEYI